jgi:hypothetical protein
LKDIKISQWREKIPKLDIRLAVGKLFAKIINIINGHGMRKNVKFLR